MGWLFMNDRLIKSAFVEASDSVSVLHILNSRLSLFATRDYLVSPNRAYHAVRD
jgi:hypothetical protein